MACKLCQQGVRLINGDHWIVKSIIPARMTIKRCPDAPKPSPGASKAEARS